MPPWLVIAVSSDLIHLSRRADFTQMHIGKQSHINESDQTGLILERLLIINMSLSMTIQVFTRSFSLCMPFQADERYNWGPMHSNDDQTLKMVTPDLVAQASLNPLICKQEPPPPNLSSAAEMSRPGG